MLTGNVIFNFMISSRFPFSPFRCAARRPCQRRLRATPTIKRNRGESNGLQSFSDRSPLFQTMTGLTATAPSPHRQISTFRWKPLTSPLSFLLISLVGRRLIRIDYGRKHNLGVFRRCDLDDHPESKRQFVADRIFLVSSVWWR